MVLWLTLILISIVLFGIQHCFHVIRGLFLMWNIPNPPSYPIIGSAHLVINKTSIELFQIATYWASQLGNYFKFWLGPELLIGILDSKDIEIVLSTKRYIDKPTEYSLLKPWLNDGLLLSTGKKWHDRRKIITTAFYPQMLENFTKTFDRLSDDVIDKLRKIDANTDIDLANLIGLFALDCVAETAMGVSIDALSKPNSDYIKAVHDISYVAHLSMVSITIRYVPLVYRFSKLRKIEENALRVVHSFVDNVIRKRRQELTENVNRCDDDDNSGDDDDMGIRKKRVLLDTLLHSSIDGEPLSDLDIREEVSVFILGGHDTITSATTFCLYNLAKHPEVQQKCFNEALNVFGPASNKHPVTLSLLNKLTYLELTIKETLRLFPPLPLIGRLAMEDIKLTNNRIIPKGSSIAVSAYTIGRHPDYYCEPNEFKPERFLEEQRPFTYLPFSAGPRNCPGQKFAVYEMKCILSKILRNFQVSLADEPEQLILTAELVMRPAKTINFNLRCRA